MLITYKVITRAIHKVYIRGIVKNQNISTKGKEVKNRERGPYGQDRAAHDGTKAFRAPQSLLSYTGCPF